MRARTRVAGACLTGIATLGIALGLPALADIAVSGSGRTAAPAPVESPGLLPLRPLVSTAPAISPPQLVVATPNTMPGGLDALSLRQQELTDRVRALGVSISTLERQGTTEADRVAQLMAQEKDLDALVASARSGSTKQELEAAHLRAVTQSAQVPAYADELAAMRGELAGLRQQLADVTDQLDALARPRPYSATGAWAARPGIPAEYLALYQRAASTCAGLSWTVLAAIGSIESDHGRSTLPGVTSGANYAGAMGPMQFLAGTWATYRVDGDNDGVANVYRAPDAIFGAANMLCHNGAGDPTRLNGAIWSYNHADWYVRDVLDLASRYRAVAVAAATTR